MDQGFKVTLKSGKTVLLREPKIKDREIAAQAVAGRSNDDQFVFVVMMAKEMLRLLIYAVDDVPISAKDLLDLDKVFTLKEFSTLEGVMKKIMEDEDEEGKKNPFVPVIELVSIGDK